MPTNPIEAKITGGLTGCTQQGSLTLVPFNFSLLDQDAHTQMTVVVAPADVLKPAVLPVLPGGSGTAQTLLVLQSDTPVQVRLNGVVDLHFAIAANAPMILPGLPEVTTLEFTGVATTNATIFVTKLSGIQTLTAPPGGGTGTIAGGLRLEDIGPATGGQTAFVLPSTPTNPDAAILYVEGVAYTSPSFFTLSGTALTWLDTNPPGALPNGARVEILYQ